VNRDRLACLDRSHDGRDETRVGAVVLMRRFVREYVIERHDFHEPTSNGFEVRCADGRTRITEVRKAVLPDDFADDIEGVVYVAGNPRDVRFPGVTVFDLSQKTYGKLGTDFEAGVISFMNSYRARFVPAERPRIGDAPGVAVGQAPEA
jgi:hypothetical protein